MCEQCLAQICGEGLVDGAGGERFHRSKLIQRVCTFSSATNQRNDMADRSKPKGDAAHVDYNAACAANLCWVEEWIWIPIDERRANERVDRPCDGECQPPICLLCGDGFG